MRLGGNSGSARLFRIGLWVAALAAAIALHAQTKSSPTVLHDDSLPQVHASPDVPLESSVYAKIERLEALGYVDSAFLAIRPWTRAECARLISEAEDKLEADDQAPNDIRMVIEALAREFAPELRTAPDPRARLESVYERSMVVSGRPLTDSYHFGETLTNDYGRPYAEGYNQTIGLNASSTLSRFAFHVRTEFQHAPGLSPLNTSAKDAIIAADGIPAVPQMSLAPRNRVAILDATAAVALGGFQITAGRQSLWWGPGRSGAMVLSDNAEPIYMLRLSQLHSVQLPSWLAYLGPMKIDSYFGHLEGHNFPPSPFFYGQKISLKPTPDLEFGFSRTVVFAGEGVTPLTFGNFFHSFFSFSSGTAPGFTLRTNPGTRHAGFDFTYRLPGLHRWGVSLYSDSVAHDDVSPVSAPRRSAINPGIYVARVPMAPKFEFRAEALSTDPPVKRSNGGKFLYWENIYRDAYTNGGQLLGSWIGREGKGGQAWLTYHNTEDTEFEVSYRRAKLAKDFIAGGGTQDDVQVTAEWRLRSQMVARATFQFERWLVPAVDRARQSDAVAGFEIRWLNVGEK